MSTMSERSTEWLKVINSEFPNGDRASAVLGGAILDDLLLTILQSTLSPPHNPKDDRLLGRGGVAESFAARIELATRMRLIHDNIAKSLDWVREIRNDAAHSKGFSLSSQSAVDRVKNVIDTLNLRSIGAALFKPPYDDNRGAYLAIVVAIGATLEQTIDNIKLGEALPIDFRGQVHFSESSDSA